MLYIITDKTKNIFGTEKKKVVKICLNENEVLSFLGKAANLKHFKGDIDVQRVIL